MADSCWGLTENNEIFLKQLFFNQKIIMEKQTNKQKNPPFLCEGTEEVSWPTRIPPTSQGCSALTGVRLRPPGSFRPTGSRHTHHEKRDKTSFNRSLPEWKLFIYTQTTREFLGRKAKSWGLILIFYPVFYGFLAARFSFTMWAMLQTLSEDGARISWPDSQSRT